MKTSVAIIGAVVWLVVTFGAAAIGACFLPDEWYRALNKPTWNPPNSIFGPVWTVLYLLMAVAAWLVWRQYGVGGALAAADSVCRSIGIELGVDVFVLRAA